MNAIAATEHDPGMWLLAEEEIKAVSGGFGFLAVLIVAAAAAIFSSGCENNNTSCNANFGKASSGSANAGTKNADAGAKKK
jgi:hypothetical protein